MRTILTAVVLVGLSVLIAKADDKPNAPPKPSTLTPEKDSRLAKRPGAQTQKIGILTYYPNKGGGYTFMEGEEIAFYALPYGPRTYRCENLVIATIGTAKMPFGSQFVYRSRMRESDPGDFQREDWPIAVWARNSPSDTFSLLIRDATRETRLKLKSIVPVLEHAEHGR